MSDADILKIIGDHDGLYYRPYSTTDVKISFGLVPRSLKAWHYIWARHNNPQNKRFSSLSGPGIFVPNTNKSGVIEIGILDGSIDAGVIDILNNGNLPFPIVVVDIGTAGTSGVIAMSCKRVDTPTWRRDALPDITPFTFETKELGISWGVRTSELEI